MWTTASCSPSLLAVVVESGQPGRDTTQMYVFLPSEPSLGAATANAAIDDAGDSSMSGNANE